MDEKILDILRDIHADYDFAGCRDFLTDGLLDSVDLLELYARLEDTFAVKFAGHDFVPENFSNIDAIHRLLVKRGAMEES